MHGFLNLRKPVGVSSRAVVDGVGRWFPKVKAGHAGTLDPLATGVLVVALGAGTRLVEYVQQMGKAYRSTFRLGATSDTDDATGALEPIPGATPPTEEKLRALLADFIGVIEQVPPAHSAAKVDGRRAYALARRGAAVDLAPRPVRIDRVDLLSYAYPDVELEVTCGKGTYIRSLARDLGAALGCGGYVLTLERTRIGPFSLAEALSWDADPASARKRVWPLHTALADYPNVSLSAALVKRLGQGARVRPPSIVGLPDATSEVAVLNERGDLAVVALWDPAAVTVSPVKVLDIS